MFKRLPSREWGGQIPPPTPLICVRISRQRPDRLKDGGIGVRQYRQPRPQGQPWRHAAAKGRFPPTIAMAAFVLAGRRRSQTGMASDPQRATGAFAAHWRCALSAKAVLEPRSQALWSVATIPRWAGQELSEQNARWRITSALHAIPGGTASDSRPASPVLQRLGRGPVRQPSQHYVKKENLGIKSGFQFDCFGGR